MALTLTMSLILDRELKEKVNDLVTNPMYKTKAIELAKQIRNEKSVDNFCDFIESVVMKNKNI